MARPHLLLVDADPRVVRVLEVNLKNDGFSVTTATDGAEAAAKLEIALPDVLVAETRLSRIDGFELVRRLRSMPGGDSVAVVLVAPEPGGPGPNGLSASAMDQLRAVELGIPDCLRKPVSVRELVTRVNLMLARRTQAMLSTSTTEQTHFSGHLQDIGVIDLLAAFESGRRSGVLQIEHAARSATVLFKHGKVVDAEQGQLRGEEALYRTLLWTTGVFDVEFVDVDVPDNVPIGTAALIMEGMRRIDEWGRLAEQLPSSTSVFTVDAEVLLGRLAEVPDDLNPVLRLFDGQRSLMGVIDESPFDDLSTLSVVSKLYFEGVLKVVELAPASVLLSARALSAGSASVGGNVIKFTPPSGHVPPIVLRPHAPAMSPDPVPRSLVYSEPPQALRLSQRPKVGASSSAGGLPSAHAFSSVSPADPRLVDDRPSGERGVVGERGIGAGGIGAHQASANLGTQAAEAEAFGASKANVMNVVAPTPAVVTKPVAVDLPPRVSEPSPRHVEREVEPVRAAAETRDVANDRRVVAEAEFEDLSADRHETAVRTAVTARTEISSRDTVASASEHVNPYPAVVAAAARPHGENDDHDKPHKELDHDFFSEGDDGQFGAEGDEELVRRSRPDVDIDPRVLAALQARRDQGRRWATWIFGVAFLLLIWGVISVVRREPEEETVAARGPAGTAPSLLAPVDPVGGSASVERSEVSAPSVAEPAPSFEEVVPPGGGARPLGSGMLGAKPASSMDMPPALGPVPPARGKKPPTARFPSTPENQ